MAGKSKFRKSAGEIKFILLLIVPFVFASTAMAQTKKPQAPSQAKVAMVDTYVFSDENKGIKVLVKAIRSYSNDNFIEYPLREQIKKLEEEINDLLNQGATINEKYVELGKLKAELSRMEESDKASESKRYSIIVGPVEKKIFEKVKEFAKLKGYFIIFDKSKLEQSPIFIEGEIEDVTVEFIKFCNDAFDKEKLQ